MYFLNPRHRRGRHGEYPVATRDELSGRVSGESNSRAADTLGFVQREQYVARPTARGEGHECVAFIEESPHLTCEQFICGIVVGKRCQDDTAGSERTASHGGPL